MLEDLFKDTFEATEEDRLYIDTRKALDEVVHSVSILDNAVKSDILGSSTLDEFKKLLLFAEQTAHADPEGLEEQKA